jgi:hypothetical protein
MKHILNKGGLILAAAMSVWTLQASAQTAVVETRTTTAGTIDEFAPGADIVVHSETSADPIRYGISRQTTFVDETGSPVAVERISRGTPVTVHYVREGDRVLADRVVVRRAPTAVVEERRAPTVVEERRAPTVVEERRAPVVEEHKTVTTTTTTGKMSHDEKERLEHERKAEKKAIEREKDRLDDLKDKLDK